MTRRTSSTLLTLALMALPGALAAQQKSARPAPARPAAAAPAKSAAQQQNPQVWLTELQQVHGKLQALQARALTDPQLASAQQALGGSIKTAMEKLDPTLAQSLTRGRDIEAEAMAAQQKGDQAKLQKLSAEMQQIQQKFVSAQQKVMQQPQLAAQLLSFEDRMQKKMTELDPQAPKLIARFEELQQKLAAAMQQGGPR